ncbi:hypothetical protein P3T36_004832 [Kitasatospora sp. MAP12-15]|nr:hypothetical protein [Kitasatospora sp. MAP12-44]
MSRARKPAVDPSDQPPAVVPDQLIQAEAAAGLLGITVGTLRNWKGKRGPQPIPLGDAGPKNRVRYSLLETLSYIEELKATRPTAVSDGAAKAAGLRGRSAPKGAAA